MMGVVGIVDDVTKVVGSSFLRQGRAVLLLDASGPEPISELEAVFGSSEYAAGSVWRIMGPSAGHRPRRRVEAATTSHSACGRESVDSAKDISEGGLAVTLAEKCFANGVGADINLNSGKLSPVLALFGEMSSQVLVSCDLAHVDRIQEVAKQREILVEPLGTTVGDSLKIDIDGVPVVSVAVAELKQAWTSALESALHAGSERNAN